jgi:hypothetical protein
MRAEKGSNTINERTKVIVAMFFHFNHLFDCESLSKPRFFLNVDKNINKPKKLGS